MEGYWGTPTASVDWCEANYVKTYYIAEFYNTLSSVAILLAAGYSTYKAVRAGLRKRLILPIALMAVVGVGSIAFHGTLLFPGQALDELPMIYAACSLFFSTMEPHPRQRYPWLGPALAVYCLAFTYAYFRLPNYFLWFILSYIALVLVQFAFAFRTWQRVLEPRVRALLLAAAAFYIGGFLLFWLPDKFLCSTVQPFHFHAWFHLTSTIGPLCAMQFLNYAFYEHLQGKAEAAARGGGVRTRQSARLGGLGSAAHEDLQKDQKDEEAARSCPQLSFHMGVLPIVTLTTTPSLSSSSSSRKGK